ncbi:MAG: TonB family protein [Chthoniobacterales bacterium]
MLRSAPGRTDGKREFFLRFDRDGYVTEVGLVQSTGSAILDQFASNTFRRWRCRPGVYEQVDVPITFTLSGAQL